MKHKIFILSLLTILFGSFYFSGMHSACATSVIELSDDQLVSMSSEIVHGEISAIEAVQISDSTILTRVTLEVKTWLKPSASTNSTFEFYTRGGTIGQITQSVPGEMQPQIGDEVVVFLERIPRYDNKPMLLGLKQGAFYAVENPSGPSKRIIQKTDGLEIQSKTNASFLSFRHTQTMDELIYRIHSKLEEKNNP